MNAIRRFFCAFVIALGGVIGVVPPVFAQEGSTAQANNERATCDGLQQDRASCLKEATAAQQAARQGGLTSEPRSYQKNASARCQFQPAADRTACESRVHGTGLTSTEGSVMGGGILTETVTPVPARTK